MLSTSRNTDDPNDTNLSNPMSTMDKNTNQEHKQISVLVIGTRVIVTTQDELQRIINDPDELAELKDS